MEAPAASFLRALSARRALWRSRRQRVRTRFLAQEQILGIEGFGDAPTRGKACFEIKSVDDGKPEAARRRGMVFGRLVLVEGDLQALNARHRLHGTLQLGRGMAIV